MEFDTGFILFLNDEPCLALFDPILWRNTVGGVYLGI
jgi:hypothetical protein